MRKPAFILCWWLVVFGLPLRAQLPSDTVESEEVYAEEGDDETEATYAERESYLADTLQLQHFNKEEWRKVVNGQTYGEEGERNKKKKAGQQQGGDEGQPGRAKEDEELQNNQSRKLAPGFQIALIALGVVLVLAVLFVLFKDIGGLGKLKKQEAAPETMAIAEEELTERSALYKLLQQALAARNYKLALRYYYLLMIAQYREQGLIKWRKDKTNYHYLRELRNHPMITDIRKATLLFEMVWYGDVEPDEMHMQQAQQLFNRILKGGGYE